ncbi:hypothetical protein WJX84_008087 [Apatococcus fuscideae]|uniref:Uncharacterized protein n=1 Tax=Apatococcus fuscideae TaxID=2026836 RepID=A0AAW1SRY5_9CHLO
MQLVDSWCVFMGMVRWASRDIPTAQICDQRKLVDQNQQCVLLRQFVRLPPSLLENIDVAGLLSPGDASKVP